MIELRLGRYRLRRRHRDRRWPLRQRLDHDRDLRAHRSGRAGRRRLEVFRPCRRYCKQTRLRLGGSLLEEAQSALALIEPKGDLSEHSVRLGATGTLGHAQKQLTLGLRTPVQRHERTRELESDFELRTGFMELAPAS